MISTYNKTSTLPNKTFFVFKTDGFFLLVSTNNGISRTQPYAQYPQQVIDVLKNMGYQEI